MASLMLAETADHGTFSCHSLEAHRRLLFSNSHVDGADGHQTSAHKASLSISNADASGHADFMTAFHNADRPQIELNGDVTFAAGSTIQLPAGAEVTGDHTATNLVAKGGGLQIKTADGSTTQAEISQAGEVTAKGLVSKGGNIVVRDAANQQKAIINATSGDITTYGDLVVNEESTLKGSVSINADADEAVTTSIRGNVTFEAVNGIMGTPATKVTMNQPLDLNSSLDVSGAVTCAGITASGSIGCNGIASTTGMNQFGSMTVSNQIAANGGVSTNGAAVSCGPITAGSGTFSSLSVSGQSTYTDRTTHNGGITCSELTCTGDMVVSGALTSVMSTELQIADKTIEFGSAAAPTDKATHRTACESVGPLELGFGGYEDSADNQRKTLGQIQLEFGASESEDQFSMSHRMEVPAIRFPGGDAQTYCELKFDHAQDKFTIVRHSAAGTKAMTFNFA